MVITDWGFDRLNQEIVEKTRIPGVIVICGTIRILLASPIPQGKQHINKESNLTDFFEKKP